MLDWKVLAYQELLGATLGLVGGMISEGIVSAVELNNLRQIASFENTVRQATQLEFNFNLANEMAKLKVTYLYQKVGKNGEHLKFGITDDLATRYTVAELNGGRLRVIAQGGRAEMLRLERGLHKTLPIGPEERQLFYIQKQIEQGLKPPPY